MKWKDLLCLLLVIALVSGFFYGLGKVFLHRGKVVPAYVKSQLDDPPKRPKIEGVDPDRRDRFAMQAMIGWGRGYGYEHWTDERYRKRATEAYMMADYMIWAASE